METTRGSNTVPRQLNGAELPGWDQTKKAVAEFGGTLRASMLFNVDKPKVLAISGHPDDVEIACGGLMARLVRDVDAELHIAVMTYGARQGDPPDIFRLGDRPRETLLASLFFQRAMAREVDRLPQRVVDRLLTGSENTTAIAPSISRFMRHAESRLQDRATFEEAASRVHFGGFKDRHLYEAGHAAIEFIESLIERIEPDIILTHAIGDLHDDHRQTYYATLSAARDYHGTVLFYQAPSTVPNDFAPTFFVCLDRQVMLIKTLSLLAHSSQRERGMRFLRPCYVSTLAEAWSRFHRKTNGWLEAFEVNRCFWPLDSARMHVPRTTAPCLPQEERG